MGKEKKETTKKVMVVIDESDCSYEALIWVLENLKESLKQSPLFLFATQPLVNFNIAVSPSLGFARLYCPLSARRFTHALSDISHVLCYERPGYICPTANLLIQTQERNRKILLGLLDKARRICASSGVNVKTFTEIGDPKVVVCNAVQEHNIDLLVIGDDSYGILKRALLGGTLADYCLCNSKCPVLVVKKSE